MDTRFDTSIECWGGFSLAPAGNQIHGRLSYSQEKGIELELLENPSGTDDHWSFEQIYGELGNGTLVTLYECLIVSGPNIQFGQFGKGFGSPTKLIANKALFGAHRLSLTELAISSYSIELSSVSSWTGSSPIKADYRNSTVTVSKPPPIKVSLPEQPFDLEITYGITQNQTSSKYHIDWAGGIVIISKTKLSFIAISEVAFQVQNLLALLIGDEITLREITFYEANDLHEIPKSEIEKRAFKIYATRGYAHGYNVDDWKQAERQLRREAGYLNPLHLIYDTTGQKPKSDCHLAEMLVPYDKIKSVFSEIVSSSPLKKVKNSHRILHPVERTCRVID